MLFIIMRCQSTLCLKKFEFRILSASVVFVHLYLILQLIIYICKFTIRTEFNQFRAGLSDTAEHIDQFQLACSCICTINFNLIDSIINRTQIFTIRSRTHAAYMRTEVSLCHTAKAFMIHTIHHTAQTSVFVCMHDCNFSIMISRNIQIFSCLIGGKMTASHAVDIYFINKSKISIGCYGKYGNSLIRYGIKIFPVQ